jgi:hypothetical protein
MFVFFLDKTSVVWIWTVTSMCWRGVQCVKLCLSGVGATESVVIQHNIFSLSPPPLREWNKLFLTKQDASSTKIIWSDNEEVVRTTYILLFRIIRMPYFWTCIPHINRFEIKMLLKWESPSLIPGSAKFVFSSCFRRYKAAGALRCTLTSI